MKISVRNLEPTKAKLTITVDQDEFDPYLEDARKEIAEQITVPGFRVRLESTSRFTLYFFAISPILIISSLSGDIGFSQST